MPNLETPGELSDWLADQIGVWGADDRSPWVADVTERIRRSVANERLLHDDFCPGCTVCDSDLIPLPEQDKAQ